MQTESILSLCELRRLSRSILADKPRVTRFPVEFDPVEAVPIMAGDAQPEGNATGPPAAGFGGDGMVAGMQQDFQPGLDLQQQQQQGFMQQQQQPMFETHGAGTVDMEA